MGFSQTPTERYLTRLARRSFLSLWSYPSPFRDQRAGASGDGKELCDLLVIFEDQAVIFSDKDCAFPDTPDVGLAWSRWFRRAIWKSAEQLWGATRWLQTQPTRVFSDRQCATPLPFSPPSGGYRIHRVVVAHDTSGRRGELTGGSGSLLIDPDLHGIEAHTGPDSVPFAIGRLDDSRGYVHVLDERSLGIVLSTLDTTSDFLRYLARKEDFILSGKLYKAFGEEDLLAFYLKDIGPDGNHDFNVPDGRRALLEEGHWENFIRRPERHRQIEADRTSYLWDTIIDATAQHAIDGTLEFTNAPGVARHEVMLRRLAREPRVRRRMLSRALLDKVAQATPGGYSFRIHIPTFPGDPHYVFVIAPAHDPALPLEPPTSGDREHRRRTLLAYSMVAMHALPQAIGIVGIATEGGLGAGRSHDVLYIDRRNWDAELAAEAAAIQDATGWLRNTRMHLKVEQEYPPEDGREQYRTPANDAPCPCGSSRPFGDCHGRTTDEPPAA